MSELNDNNTEESVVDERAPREVDERKMKLVHQTTLSLNHCYQFLNRRTVGFFVG